MNKIAAFVVSVLALVAVCIVQPLGTVEAACGVATDMGTATSTVNVSQAGTYKMWFRIKPSSSANNAAYVQVDGGTCYKIGDNSALAAGSWVWVNYSQNGTTQTPITHNFTAGNHTLALVGSETGVQVDRTILLSNSDGCTPSNQKSGSTNPGDNCLATSNTNNNQGGTSNNGGGGAVVATTKSGEPIRAATNNSTVTGSVVFNPEIVNDTSVQKVEYYEAGKLIYTSTEMPFHLDTSVLSDGTHTITEKVIYKDGHAEETTSTITVANQAAAATKKTSKFNWLAVGIGAFVLIAGLGALVYFNPTLHQFVANKISRITGRAARF